MQPLPGERVRSVNKSSYGRHREVYDRSYQVVDLTSNTSDPRFQPLSSYFPHGNLSVPGKPGTVRSYSVEGLWQALKVFANQDGVAIPWDAKPMELSTLIAIQKGVKRKPPKGGQVLGHSYNGEDGQGPEVLLGYTQAREMIFIPAYRAAIEQHPGAREAVCLILEMARNGPPVLLLDAHSNADPHAPKPLSAVRAVLVPLILNLLEQERQAAAAEAAAEASTSVMSSASVPKSTAGT